MQSLALRSPSAASRAALWMMGALASFVIMAIGGRELAAELGTFQILFFRSLIGLIVIGGVIWRQDRRLIFTQQIGVHLLRNIAHYGGQWGWFYGLGLIPLAEVFALEFTVPVWTAILAALLLGERLTRARLAAIGFGMVGMLLILRPGVDVVQLAALAVLGAAICYGLAHTFTKKLTRTDSALTILFYMTVIQLPLGLIPSLVGWVTPSPILWPWLLAVGLTALTAHYCMTRALTLADATVVVPMDFLRLPLIAVVGFLFYGESLAWSILAGASMMLLGNLINIRAERRSAPSKG
jgi:drug/metabolite transporter (DMT)-like permease